MPTMLMTCLVTRTKVYVWLLISSIKYKLITKSIAQMEVISRDKSIKSNWS